ncbi:MAG: T9SS type A sorting domain-containing protein, partial [Bacteroidota bacterium]
MLPMAMEAEIALRGLVQKKSPVEAANIRLGTPGAKHSHLLPEEASPNQPAYPTYNEALGLIGILEDAVVLNNRRLLTTQSALGSCGGTPVFQSWRDFRNQFRFEDLPYLFNPVSEVDVAETELFGAIEIRFPTGIPMPDQVFNLFPHPGQTNRLLSPFLPLADLTNLEVAYDYEGFPVECTIVEPDPAVQIFLKLLIRYKFDPVGSDGKAITHVQELTIPTTLSYRPPEMFPSPGDLTHYPRDLVFDSPTAFSTNETIFSWGDVVISEDLQTAPGVSVTILASESITIEPGADVSPGISLKVGFFRDPPYWHEVPALTSATFDVAGYCQNGTYQANQPLARLSQPNASASLRTIEAFTLFPNPTREVVRLRYNLFSKEQTQVEIRDLMGRLVWQGPEKTELTGEHEQEVDVGVLAAGVYVVTLTAGKRKETRRLIKE